MSLGAFNGCLAAVEPARKAQDGPHTFATEYGLGDGDICLGYLALGATRPLCLHHVGEEACVVRFDVLPRVERFDRRGTEPFEPFRTIRILSK